MNFIGGEAIETIGARGRKMYFLAWSIFLFSSPIFSADAQRGQNLYQNCISCHGVNGEGNIAEKAPRIAGQHDWYIISSIEAFKVGKERRNDKMLPYIRNLSERDIQDLAAYISGLDPL